jgi:hypothetical protein
MLLATQNDTVYALQQSLRGENSLDQVTARSSEGTRQGGCGLRCVFYQQWRTQQTLPALQTSDAFLSNSLRVAMELKCACTCDMRCPCVKLSHGLTCHEESRGPTIPIADETREGQREQRRTSL